MPHRYGRRSTLLLPALALLALAAPARAQFTGQTTVPADAPVVATTASGAAVIVWRKGSDLCSTIQKAGQPRPAIAGSPRRRPDDTAQPLACASAPAPGRFAAGWLGSLNLGPHHDLTWGYAGPGIATVQHKAGGRVVASTATGPPGALPAPVADLRFWSIEVDEANPATVDEVAVLDDAGVVRRAYEPERFGGVPNAATADEQSEEPTGSILRAGHAGRVTWELHRRVASVFAPTPLQPERRVRQACVALLLREKGSSQWAFSPCDDALSATPMATSTASSCTAGAAVTVITTAAVRRVAVVTGDGARRPVRLVPLTGGERAGVLVLGHGVAVRRVVALGGDGRVLAAKEIAQAPAPRHPTFCGGLSGGYDVPGRPLRRLGAAPHVPRAVDHGVELCTAVDRAPQLPGDCAIPPLDPAEARISIDRSADGRYLFGVVPPEVVAARVTLVNGDHPTFPAAALPGYTGIYAGAVRAIAADVAGPKAVRRIELLDDRGRVLNPEASANLDPTAWGRAVDVLPAAHDAPPVRAVPADALFGGLSGVVRGPGRGDDFDCGAGLVAGQASTGPATVGVDARCAPRRMLVFAALAHAGDRLVVRTTAGRTVTARTAPFPAAAGRAARGRFFALAVLGPHEAPAAALVRGREAGRIPIDLPPVGRQCGYQAAPGLVAAFAKHAV